MIHTKKSTTAYKKHKKILKLAKGYRGSSSTNFKVAIQKVEKGLQYAYKDRRKKKNNFRSLYIQGINTGTRENGITYSRFINGLTLKKIKINRKILADLSLNEAFTFKSLLKLI